MAGKRFYPELESLRGIAACAVMIWHAFSFGRLPNDNFRQISRVLYDASELAVLGFFVLSAFVLSNSLRNNWQSATSLPAFWIKRLFRIWPLAIAVVLVAYFFFQWAHPLMSDAYPWPRYADFRWAILTRNLLFLNTAFNPPGWTLPYEVAGYIVVPLVFVATRTPPSLKSLAAMCAAIVCWCLLADFLGSWANLSQAFGVGMIAYLLHERFPNKDWTLPAMIVFLVVLVIRTQQPEQLAWTAVSSAGLAGLLLASISSKPIAEALTARPLLWLGKVSYSIYLVHYPIMWATACAINNGAFEINEFGVWLAFCLISIPLALFASRYTYAAIEHPFMRLGTAIAGALHIIAAEPKEYRMRRSRRPCSRRDAPRSRW